MCPSQNKQHRSPGFHDVSLGTLPIWQQKVALSAEGRQCCDSGYALLFESKNTTHVLDGMTVLRARHTLCFSVLASTAFINGFLHSSVLQVAFLHSERNVYVQKCMCQALGKRYSIADSRSLSWNIAGYAASGCVDAVLSSVVICTLLLYVLVLNLQGK